MSKDDTDNTHNNDNWTRIAFLPCIFEFSALKKRY